MCDMSSLHVYTPHVHVSVSKPVLFKGLSLLKQVRVVTCSRLPELATHYYEAATYTLYVYILHIYIYTCILVVLAVQASLLSALLI